MYAFIDTSYLVAIKLKRDQHHQVALQHWEQIVKSSLRLVTTSYIFDEVVTFLNSRGYHKDAVDIGWYLLQSSKVQLIHVDEALFFDGWAYFENHHDKRYSLTDCISFIVMKQLHIVTAFAFNGDFIQAGFEQQPVTK